MTMPSDAPATPASPRSSQSLAHPAGRAAAGGLLFGVLMGVSAGVSGHHSIPFDAIFALACAVVFAFAMYAVMAFRRRQQAGSPR